MSATDLFKEGNLSAAIEAQVREVKAHPADQARRLFLFELFCFAGDLDRARKQIDAIQYDDPAIDSAVSAYRALLESEKARRRLFTDGQKPEFLADQPFHLRMRLDAAMNALSGHRVVDAAGLVSGAATASPAVPVLLNGKPYDSIRDVDDLFGNVLEVMALGKYYWVPLEQVATLAINPPRFPRDLIWIPARLEMRDGPSGEVFLPSLYPGSHDHPDDRIKLGRMSDWKTLDGDLVLGSGVHTYLAGDDDVSILEWRELQVLDPA